MEAKKTRQGIPTSNQIMLNEVKNGLSRPQKTLPSKYFYDKRGSQLFEVICELDAYYLANTEVQILENNIDEMVAALGSGIRLIEPGSGNSRKTRLLLNRLNNVVAYIPVEIAETFLTSTVEQLSNERPELQIQPVVADYTQPFELPPKTSARSRDVVFYPGSTIGNFTPGQANNFMGMIAELIGKNGSLLIGVDLKKDPEILKAAYNDGEGVTAMFNKNLLIHLNRKLNTNFNIDLFKHRAFYNRQEGRIEMHLVSLEKQTVKIDREDFRFRQGETIHTENSYKYSLKEFEQLAAPHFTVKKVWTDKNGLFSVQYLVPDSP